MLFQNRSNNNIGPIKRKKADFNDSVFPYIIYSRKKGIQKYWEQFEILKTDNVTYGGKEYFG